MTTWAIIPVKQLEGSKLRLANVLSSEERATLIHTFLDRLLGVLNGVAEIDHIMMVTADDTVMKLGRKHGAMVLPEPQSVGLNKAVQRATTFAEAEGATAVLVLPADLPFATEADITHMLQPLANGGRTAESLMAICGDEANDGTNGLLLAPPGDFEFHYGPGSYGRHIIEATRQSRTTHIVHAPGLRFDLDSENDWMAYNGRLLQVADE